MLKWHFWVFGFAKKFPRKTMWLLDLFGSGLVNLKSQNLKSVLPCACFHGFFSRVLGFPVTMLHTLIQSLFSYLFIKTFISQVKRERGEHLEIYEPKIKKLPLMTVGIYKKYGENSKIVICRYFKNQYVLWHLASFNAKANKVLKSGWG